MSARWHRVCRADEVPRDRPLGCVIGDSGQDRDRVCVVRCDDDAARCDAGGGTMFVALLDRCPHRDIALSGGLVRDGELVCPGHFWRFDLVTGRQRDNPQGATVYETRVASGWVEALVPEPSPPRSMREWLLAHAASSSR